MSKRKAPPPLPRQLLLIPGIILLAAIVLAVLGFLGFAAAALLGAIGAWLVVMGKHRRWKGAPEGGYVMIGFGVLIVLLALFA